MQSIPNSPQPNSLTSSAHSQPYILAQNQAFSERKLRLRWILALSALPLFGIFAAFGTAPSTSVQDVNVQTVIEDITLPQDTAPSFNLQQSASYWQVDQVKRDDTLASLLKRLNIRNTTAIDFLRNSTDARPFSSKLRPGQTIQAQTDENGVLQQLIYLPDNNNQFTVSLRNQDYVAQMQAINSNTVTVIKSGTIQGSLFAATDAADIPDQVAMQLVEIFSSDIDFHSDLRRGDHFSVVYESNFSNGEVISTGKVLAAEFINAGKTYRAVMYQHPSGEVSYYTPDGKSLHKSFLRSPLEFSRVSSGFSLGRFHPILQKIRAHKGVDYAAPIGTRVKASGDATVEFVGVKGGYGNVIVLRHANDVSTVYGHLSRFAPGLHKGNKVSQGDIIGFVGMTGLATGPHLHYEFLLHGEHRDPLKVALPTALPLPSQYHADFMHKTTALFAKLDLLRNSQLAALESE